MAPLARSMLAQNFCTSLVQAARYLARASSLAASGVAPPELAGAIGHYRELGREAARILPNASLVEFPDLGHSPQVESPSRFHAALLTELAR